MTIIKSTREKSEEGPPHGTSAHDLLTTMTSTTTLNYFSRLLLEINLELKTYLKFLITFGLTLQHYINKFINTKQ
jgi:hypothetical protein